MKLQMTTAFSRLATLLAIGLFASVPSAADNIVLDPSFNSPGSWITPNTVYGSWVESDFPSQDAQGGSIGTDAICQDYDQCFSTNINISEVYFYQDLTTVPSETYDLSFYVSSTGAGGVTGLVAGIEVFWGPGSTLVDRITYDDGTAAPNFQLGQWDLYIVTGLVATSTSTELRFVGFDNPGDIFVDEVSVQPEETSVPEPASLALLASGFIGLAFRSCRKKSFGSALSLR